MNICKKKKISRLSRSSRLGSLNRHQSQLQLKTKNKNIPGHPSQNKTATDRL